MALAALAARGDDGLTAEKAAALRAAAERLREPLTAESAWAFEIPGFAAEDYGLALEAVPELPEGVRVPAERACRTAALRLGPVGKVGSAREACFLLASRRDGDWLKAFQLLRREPLGDELDAAAVALGKDGRPEVRLVAARLAASLVVFGRKADGLVDTLVACSMDPHPNVVAAFALFAPDIRDKRAIDAMVASLRDERATDRRAPPILNLGEANSVSDFVQANLSWEFWHERRARCKFEPPKFDAAGNRLPSHEQVYVRLSPDEIRTWWRENRDAFGFGTPAPQWRCVFDDVLVVDVGKRLVVGDADGRLLKIDLKVYDERWGDRGPETEIQGEIHSDVLGEEDYVAGFSLAGTGGVSRERATWGDGTIYGEIDCRAAFLPTDRPGRVRMKLTIHIGHLGR